MANRILDIFGRVFGKTPDEAHTSRVASTGPRDWPELGAILSNVTPGQIKAIFDEADNGQPGRQIELAQTIRERDDHLQSVDQIRRMAVTGVEFLIEPGDESDQAVKAADAFRSMWEDLDAEAIIGRMMDAVLEQWHVEEIVWDTDGKIDGKRFWRPEAIEEVDARKLCWPYSYGTPAEEAAAPQLMNNWSISDTTELAPGKFLLHSYRARRGRPGRGALVRCVAALWMFKRFSLIDLASLIEQWGRPWPVLKYDSKATSEQVADWLETLAESMADRAIAIPMGSECEVKAAGAAGADTPHINLITLCNQSMSKVLVGSTTISDAASSNDSVSSPTHADVRQDIRNADCKAIATSIRDGLAVPFTLWNFGENVAVPVVRPNLAPKPDPATRSQVYISASQLGIKVKSEQLYRELSIEKPDDVEDVIVLGAGGQQAAVGLPAWLSSPVPAEKPKSETAAVATTQEAEVLPDLVLNGAQIQAAIDIVKGVALGEMPRDAGIGQLQVLFNLTPEQAEQIMGSAGTSTPTTPNPRPAQEGQLGSSDQVAEGNL